MIRKFCLFLCAAGSILQAQEDCVSGVKSKQLWIRHTEPKGVGYRQGYTTLEAFMVASEEFYGFYPYGDLRAHIFNDGRYASNIGIGGRALAGNRIYGANTYYDARGTKEITFNQLSLGFETIGTLWDFYANGYLVIGRKNSPDLKVTFDHFENHFLFLKRHIDSAMSGVDANFRFHFLKKRKWDAYFDLGPYYYHGSFSQNLVGGKTGVGAIMADLFYVEATASYDNVFKWIGQGIAGIRLPLGKKTVINNCSDENRVLSARLMQIPDHNEIIVVKRNHKASEAIDPATGDPFFFWFVNNQSSSNGTFESPYPMLATAEAASGPRDVIYVFQGDGTSNNMSSGITLKDSQQLLGSGIIHTFNTTRGLITIPAFTSGLPMITNSSGVGVTLANSNIISGIHINQPTQYGIFGIGVANATIENNVITEITMGVGDTAGIYLQGPGLSGSYVINANRISGSSAAADMHGMFILSEGTDFTNVYISNNYIDLEKSGVEMKTAGTSFCNSTITGNSFITHNAGGKGFYIKTNNQSLLEFNVYNNSFVAALNAGLVIETHDDGSVMRGFVMNNQFINSKEGLNIETRDETKLTVNVGGNIFANNTMRDFFAKTHQPAGMGLPSKLCVTLSGNSAPTHEFIIEKAFNTSILNITSFTGNIGNLVDAGAFPFTQFPTCPFSE